MAAKVLGPLDPTWPNSEKFLTALGRLVAESALLESTLDLGITLFITPQRTARIVAAELDFRKKLELLLALVREHVQGEELREKLVVLLKVCHGLYNERNTYIHGLWAAGPTAEERGLIRASAKGQFKFEVKNVDFASIEALGERFDQVTQKMHATLFELLLT
jgi:hypothetical protein